MSSWSYHFIGIWEKYILYSRDLRCNGRTILRQCGEDSLFCVGRATCKDSSRAFIAQHWKNTWIESWTWSYVKEVPTPILDESIPSQSERPCPLTEEAVQSGIAGPLMEHEYTLYRNDIIGLVSNLCLERKNDNGDSECSLCDILLETLYVDCSSRYAQSQKSMTAQKWEEKLMPFTTWREIILFSRSSQFHIWRAPYPGAQSMFYFFNRWSLFPIHEFLRYLTFYWRRGLREYKVSVN